MFLEHRSGVRSIDEPFDQITCRKDRVTASGQFQDEMSQKERMAC